MHPKKQMPGDGTDHSTSISMDRASKRLLVGAAGFLNWSALPSYDVIFLTAEQNRSSILGAKVNSGASTTCLWTPSLFVSGSE